MKYDKEEMIKLKEAGKTYLEISKILNCSEWTVKYHLMKCRKKSQIKYEVDKKLADPLCLKCKRFKIKGTVIPFTLDELKSKIGNNPKCYLTNEPINLMNPNTYSLDHRIPVSRGGKSSIENVELVKLDINQAKYNMTPDEFKNLCKRVIQS